MPLGKQHYNVFLKTSQHVSPDCYGFEVVPPILDDEQASSLAESLQTTAEKVGNATVYAFERRQPLPQVKAIIKQQMGDHSLLFIRADASRQTLSAQQ